MFNPEWPQAQRQRLPGVFAQEFNPRCPFSSSLINTDTPGRLQMLALDSNETKTQVRSHRFKFPAEFLGVFRACFGISLVCFGISLVCFDISLCLDAQIKAH